MQGDTTSAMAAAIAAYNMAIPVAHIEAGLRSGDLSSPFPEEGNRRLISSVATLHLAPTKRARHNLITEGIDPGKIVITGNTVIDALRWALSSGKQAPDAWVLGSVPPTRHLVLATTHRRESWGQPLQGTIDGLEALAKQDAGTHILLPVHPNPRVRDPIQARLGNLDNVTLCEPLSYLTMCQALARASVVVTDSGGLQEEAPSLGVPVVVLRETTERPEAVETGWAELVGTEPELIVRATTRRLDQAASASRLPGTVSSGPFGDGNAARRCLDAIRWALDEGPRPSDFVAPTGGAGGTVTPDPDVHIGPPAST